MPKAWNEREKEIIRQTLREEGKKLFVKYGIQKTTVDEIVRAVRISKGAFYQFYTSKEELFFDILESIETELRVNLFSEVFSPERSNKESFRLFLNRFFEMLVSMPLFEQLTSTDYDYLLRKLPSDKLEQHTQRDFADMSRYFKDWMDRGFLKKVDVTALSGMFLSLFYFVMHRDDLVNLDFEATKGLWVDMLTSYLVKE